MIYGSHREVGWKSSGASAKVNTVFESTINGASALSGVTVMLITLKSLITIPEET